MDTQTGTQTLYDRMAEKLGNRQSRKVDHNTYLQRRDENTLALLYHATDIVTYYADGRVVVNTGGWLTSTTKLRLNESYSGLTGFQFYQSKKVWYVTTPTFAEPRTRTHHCYECRKHWDSPVTLSEGTQNLSGERSEFCPTCGKKAGYSSPYARVTVPFADGLTLTPDEHGTLQVDMDTIGKDPKAQRKANARVKKYAWEFIAALKGGLVNPPSAGDCLYCAMRSSENGKTWGEQTRDASHIISHIDESYFVPSLLVRAMETGACSKAMRWAVQGVWQDTPKGTDQAVFERISGSMPDFVWPQLAKMLAKYIMSQLGGAR